MDKTTPRFKKVLVTTDFSAASLAAIPYALEEARDTNGRVTLVNVVEGFAVPFAIGELAPSPAMIEELRGLAIKQAEQQLDKIVKQQSSQTLDAKVLHGVRSVADIVCDFAKAENFDLIVMSSHGHGFIQRFVLGSVVERVLRHAACAVLVVPQKQ